MSVRRGQGDGDACPINPDHGQMYTLVAKGGRSQYCPDQSHDGVWGEGGKALSTPRIWPFHHFADAVKRYHESNATTGEVDATALPDLSFLHIGGLDA